MSCDNQICYAPNAYSNSRLPASRQSVCVAKNVQGTTLDSR